jgi:hypothetical protein
MAQGTMPSGMRTKGAKSLIKTKQRRLAAPLLEERLIGCQHSCPNAALTGSFRRIGGERLIRLEVQIAFDRQA